MISKRSVDRRSGARIFWQDAQFYCKDCCDMVLLHMLTCCSANVVVYNYQYLLDPKIAGMVSRELERNSIVINDEAHNLDSICIEAMSVSINKRTLEASASNLDKISGLIRRMETTDAARLNEEYRRLVEGLAQTGVIANAHGPQASSSSMQVDEVSGQRRVNGGEDILANPLLPEDILRESVPGNIRRAKHFVRRINDL
jgi:DNA excision repair protein ERCC-2